MTLFTFIALWLLIAAGAALAIHAWARPRHRLGERWTDCKREDCPTCRAWRKSWKR